MMDDNGNEVGRASAMILLGALAFIVLARRGFKAYLPI